MRVGDKRFRILDTCEIQELEFRGKNDKGYIFHDKSKVEVILWAQAVDRLSVSYRMVLTEIEEILRRKIEVVHWKLRQLNVKFNPVGSPSAIYKYSSAYFEPVHRYNKITGLYIDSFSSISEAYNELSKPYGGCISAVCRGKRKSIYGYKWSYKKQSRI